MFVQHANNQGMTSIPQEMGRGEAPWVATPNQIHTEIGLRLGRASAFPDSGKCRVTRTFHATSEISNHKLKKKDIGYII
jgi:hypothetical protein